MKDTRPFREDDAPGRIPESLIDSVLDGSVDSRTRREVARALRHDPRRRQDVTETIEAISALRGPVECPDLSGGVLAELDRKHRFLSPRARRFVKRARFSGVLVLLAGLITVAGVQRAVPRLASVAPQPTPVSDITSAVQTETAQAADRVREGVRVMQASMAPLSGSLEMPGRSVRVRDDVVFSTAGGLSSEDRYRILTMGGGRLVLVEYPGPGRAIASGRGGFVSSISGGVVGGLTDEESETRERPLGTDSLP
ncbi:MAG: hypothetical protein LAT64_07545 [Phycisphaerales bacterium]|nr:hypothetical protein [Planctomycetota bacterium]MCH8508610.1 hypothetical protein [Phycisphaerales bacterium]